MKNKEKKSSWSWLTTLLIYLLFFGIIFAIVYTVLIRVFYHPEQLDPAEQEYTMFLIRFFSPIISFILFCNVISPASSENTSHTREKKPYTYENWSHDMDSLLADSYKAALEHDKLEDMRWYLLNGAYNMDEEEKYRRVKEIDEQLHELKPILDDYESALLHLSLKGPD